MTTGTLPQSVFSTKTLLSGVIGGVVGGIVFGIMMGVQNMLPMVGMLVGQDSAVVGFFVHMAISVFIGATFGIIGSRIPKTLAMMTIAGAVYGVVWWVLGALILMPLMLGMNDMVFQIGDMQISSLIGHLVFGGIMGITTYLVSNRS